jgi:hypothetical protein
MLVAISEHFDTMDDNRGYSNLTGQMGMALEEMKFDWCSPPLHDFEHTSWNFVQARWN